MNGDGQCCMYLLSETRMGKDDVVVKDVKIGVEKEGVWDLIWAHDDQTFSLWRIGIELSFSATVSLR